MMLKRQKNVKLPAQVKVDRMDKATLAALKKSIKHWEENVAAKTSDEANPYGNSCALCDIFLVNNRCDGCPVKASTGWDGCVDTPWAAAEKAYQHWDLARKFARKKVHHRYWVVAATRELEFLRSLLPKLVKRVKKRK